MFVKKAFKALSLTEKHDKLLLSLMMALCTSRPWAWKTDVYGVAVQYFPRELEKEYYPLVTKFTIRQLRENTKVLVHHKFFDDYLDNVLEDVLNVMVAGLKKYKTVLEFN